MKIQYKAASIMILFGAIIVVLLSLGYYMQNNKIIKRKELNNLKQLSEEVAQHLASRIEEKAAIAATLSSAPLLRDALLKSNSEFAALTDRERKQEIDNRNQQWMKTADINSPFIQRHMTNPVAEHFKYQSTILPGEYGEIFLTNRYGVMIATTGKLTTLAHAQKYWWVASYDDGQGRIFLDDRGFDMSVQGYVLGVVIPIKADNKIIGILKCNVNILGPLTNVVREYDERHPGRLKIVRTGGLIIAESDVHPLSTKVNEALVKLLWQKENGGAIIAENNENQLVAFSPIRTTMGSKQFGFGGSKESIDHINGNTGEGWHIAISLGEEEAVKSAREVNRIIIYVGIIFTLLASGVAYWGGKWAAKPIVELAATAQDIGEGRLEARASVHSNDEIGFLAQSINRMAKNLQEAIASRDEFEHHKNVAETEVKTLQGILPICASCKKIRDDKGTWNILEAYIETRTDALFSHGMCRECADKLYGDEKWYQKNKEPNSVNTEQVEAPLHEDVDTE